MFQPRVAGTGINQANQPELADPREATHFGRVEKLAYAIGQRHVQLVRNPHEMAAAVEGLQLGKIGERHCLTPASAAKDRGSTAAAPLPKGTSSSAALRCSIPDPGSPVP